MSDANAPRDEDLTQVIDLRVHRLTAVKKAAYRVADRCTVVLGVAGDERLTITFMFAPGANAERRHEAIRCFHRDLLDEDLRAELAEQTEGLRSLILAHAFSRADLIDRP